MTNIIRMLIVTLFMIQMCETISYARPFGGKYPDAFGFGIGMGNVGKEKKIKEGQIFSFGACLYSNEGNIENIKIIIRMPSELEIRGKGVETAWDGYLNAGQEKCLDIGLKSRTQIDQWSSDISAHVEFTHEGLKYKRDVTWGPGGFKDSGFIQVK